MIISPAGVHRLQFIKQAYQEGPEGCCVVNSIVDAEPDLTSAAHCCYYVELPKLINVFRIQLLAPQSPAFSNVAGGIER